MFSLMATTLKAAGICRLAIPPDELMLLFISSSRMPAAGKGSVARAVYRRLSQKFSGGRPWLVVFRRDDNSMGRRIVMAADTDSAREYCYCLEYIENRRTAIAVRHVSRL